MPPRRSNRVGEFAAVVVAYVAAVAAAFAPPSPTGRPLVDALLVALSVGIVTWAGASAPWWALVVASGVAIVSAADLLLGAIAFVAFLIALCIGVQRRNLPEWRAASVGISLNVLAWSHLDGFFGLTAILGIATTVFVFVFGIRRRPRRIRRVAWIGAVGVAVVAVLAGAGFGLSASQARAELRQGRDAAEDGIDLLSDGQFAEAAEMFESASASLHRAEDRLGSPFAAASSAVPVVAQHRAAAVELTSAGADATGRIAEALRQIDLQQLHVQGGTIDLAAIAALGQPFADVDGALDELSVAVARSRSPWLLPQLGDELDTLATRIADNAPKLQNARDAVALAPQMLGGDGPRTYLVLFTSPAEARGLGGFTGNYAQLTIDHGQIAMTAFGRVSDLETQATAKAVRIADQNEFLADYGRFGFDLDGHGLVGNATFRNLTMTPNFPSVGHIAADVYEQVTGTAVDGVIVMDPYVIQTLLSYTDGITLTTVPVELTSKNAAAFILKDQYAIAQDNPTRIDALDEAAQKTVAALLAGLLPDPAQLGRDLGPLATERRLLMWSKYPAEQDLLRRTGLLGAIPAAAGADGWSFTVNNAGASKIDTYLERRADYRSTTDPKTGETMGVLRVQLTNTAPASGLPDYVIGNAVDRPVGTSRMYVSFYSPLALQRATFQGQPVALSPGQEAGWNVYSQYVELPAGTTATFELHVAGRLEHPDQLVTWTQPLALPLEQLG